MSKRRARVPDFSTKKPVAKVPPVAGQKPPPAPHTPAPAIKPQSTSQKSGRRGG
jgi:hypothetical protein